MYFKSGSGRCGFACKTVPINAADNPYPTILNQVFMWLSYLKTFLSQVDGLIAK
jgi:hypothetical protein